MTFASDTWGRCTMSSPSKPCQHPGAVHCPNPREGQEGGWRVGSSRSSKDRPVPSSPVLAAGREALASFLCPKGNREQGRQALGAAGFAQSKSGGGGGFACGNVTPAEMPAPRCLVGSLCSCGAGLWVAAGTRFQRRRFALRVPARHRFAMVGWELGMLPERWPRSPPPQPCAWGEVSL